MLLESESIPDNRRRSETHLVRRDETDRTTANHSIFATGCHVRQDPTFADPRGCVEIESAVPAESLTEGEEWRWSWLCCLICVEAYVKLVSK
jgi:hypothetical protein